MPTLVNELTQQQRSWIFETFGQYGENDELSNGEASSDDLESHYNHHNTNNNNSSSNRDNDNKNHEMSTPVRRNSNESIHYSNDPSPTPYIHVHHPHPYHQSTTGSPGTDLPPLSAELCDPTMVDTVTTPPNNRSSIFRRNIGSSTPSILTEANPSSPVREEDNEGGGRRASSPTSTLHNRNGPKKGRTEQPHPGSIWSPLNDKAIIATPPSTDHPVFGNNHHTNTTRSNSSSTSLLNYDPMSPNISNTATTTAPSLPSSSSFNIFPRPPFSRSMHHNHHHHILTSPTIATTTGSTTTMMVRLATTTTTTSTASPPTRNTTAVTTSSSPPSSSSRPNHRAINDEDQNFHLHYPHHAPNGASHLQPQLQHHFPHHPMYAMRPIPHHHHHHPQPHHLHHSSAPLGHSKVSMTPEQHGQYHHRNSMHTSTPHHHHSDHIGMNNKSIIFPHSEDKLTWQQSFENLKIYKRIYGDCNVPQKYKMNVKLGGWVVRSDSNKTIQVCFSTVHIAAQSNENLLFFCFAFQISEFVE